jgi:hypothetical protein
MDNVVVKFIARPRRIEPEDRRDLRIKKSAAQRLITQYLCDVMPPGEANHLASRICEGIQAAMPRPTKPA